MCFLKNNFIKLKLTYHKIHSPKVYNSVIFMALTSREICHHNPDSDVLMPQQDPRAQVQSIPTPASTLAATDLLSVSADVPLWDISSK